VSSELRIPDGLKASVAAGGRARSDWLAALPERVDDLIQRWELKLTDPFEPGGYCSWVAPGFDRDGREVVLKVAWPHTEALHEAEGLSALASHGAVAVFRFEHLPSTEPGSDLGATALLLERCRPGVELRVRPEAEQHAVIADLLRSVRTVELPATLPFRPLAVMVDDWVARAEVTLAADPDRMDVGLARDGLALFEQLARDATEEALLITDLHAGNVLSSSREPWLLIDPKPYVGDPHYDVVQHLLNCDASLKTDPLGLTDTVAELARLDVTRVRQWLFARCVQQSLSDDPPWPGLDIVLERLGNP
jgi:streptomycin 6-kinase